MNFEIKYLIKNRLKVKTRGEFWLEYFLICFFNNHLSSIYFGSITSEYILNKPVYAESISGKFHNFLFFLQKFGQITQKIDFDYQKLGDIHFEQLQSKHRLATRDLLLEKNLSQDKYSPKTYFGLYKRLVNSCYLEEFISLDWLDYPTNTLLIGKSSFGVNNLFDSIAIQTIMLQKLGLWIISDSSTWSKVNTMKNTKVFENVIFLENIDIFEGNDQNSVEVILDIFKNLWKSEITDKIWYYTDLILQLMIDNQNWLKIINFELVIENEYIRQRALENCQNERVKLFWSNFNSNQK